MLVLAMAAFAGFGAAPSQATTWFEVTIKCPIGGKKFKSAEMGSNSYFGQRPDGRPYSPSPIPPISECPDNGFVIFDRELPKTAIDRLAPLVASDEYQALRKTETRHYRASWLMERIGHNGYDRAYELMIAGWESDDQPERKARYQTEFAAAVLALERGDARRDDWFWLRLRAANALRETGRFDEAGAVITATYRPEYFPSDADESNGAKFLVEGLRDLLHDRNRTAEPANLIPPMEAIMRCRLDGLSAAETAACASPRVREAFEDRRKDDLSEGQDEAATAASAAASDAAAAATEAANEAAEAARSAARAAKRMKRERD